MKKEIVIGVAALVLVFLIYRYVASGPSCENRLDLGNRIVQYLDEYYNQNGKYPDSLDSSFESESEYFGVTYFGTVFNPEFYRNRPECYGKEICPGTFQLTISCDYLLPKPFNIIPLRVYKYDSIAETFYQYTT